MSRTRNRTLLRKNLRLTLEERIRQLTRLANTAAELRRAMRARR